MKKIKKVFGFYLLLVGTAIAVLGCGAASSQSSTEMTVNTSTSAHSQKADDEGEDLFAPDTGLEQLIEDYTVGLFDEAYSSYYTITGYDFHFQTLTRDEDDAGFQLWYQLTIHYQTQTSQEERTTVFPLYLEASDRDTDLFALYYVTNDTTSNKGLPYVPIEDVFPAKNTATVSIPIGSEEYFGRIRIASGILTLEELKWVDDLNADNGYKIQDLNQTAVFDLGDTVQITYLNFGATSDSVSLTNFETYLTDQETQEARGVYWVYVKDSQVVAIVEQYRP